uniref:Uncharacterized protein n=1 Tax=Oncorhynchus mykiss TaxID=8022 RepID=A0A8K9X4I9_ONCMY
RLWAPTKTLIYSPVQRIQPPCAVLRCLASRPSNCESSSVVYSGGKWEQLSVLSPLPLDCERLQCFKRGTDKYRGGNNR